MPTSTFLASSSAVMLPSAGAFIDFAREGLAAPASLLELPTSTFLASSLAVPLPSAGAAFVGLCGRLAAPASLLVSAAPLPTISKIKSDNDVGSLPLLPYSCMACNCILWTCYGALRHTPSIWMPNGVSFLLSLYYMHSFIESANESSARSIDENRSFMLQIGTVGGIIAAAGLAFHNDCSEAVGSAAVLLCMALFASPLSTLKTAIETKSAASIPLPFTLASLLACFFWSVTGFLELHDMNVILPNFTGFLFGLAQLGLKLRFRDDVDPDDLLSSSSVDLDVPNLTHDTNMYAASSWNLLQKEELTYDLFAD